MIVILIVIAGATAGSLVKMMSNTSKGFLNTLAATEALYLAQSGLEWARFQIRDDPCATTDWSGSSGSITVNGTVRGEFTASFQYNSVTGERTLTGTGFVPSQTDARGRRSVTWTIPSPRCSGAALYADNLRIRKSNRVKVNGTSLPKFSNSSLGNTVDTNGGIFGGASI